MPTPLCTRCTRRSLSPCPNLNLIHYRLPNVSTAICRLRPLIFLPPSKPLSCALEAVLTLCESIMA
ncbi:hypothetical protein GB851_00890 [Kingella kingae]|nr:hypothetical protein GB851_00890 [Kingella kingae]